MISELMTPPCSPEAEQSVIGGLMLGDDSSERTRTVLSLLKPEAFYNRAHQVIYAEMQQMFRDNKPVDGLTLFDALESKGLTERVGGFAYLAELSKNTPSAANIVAYAMSVRESAMERYGIQRMTEATELLYARNGMTATQKFEAVQSIFTQMADHAKTGSRRGARALSDVMEDWIDELEMRFDPKQRSRGLSTGIPSLDALLEPKGLVRGSLLVIGARPKMGKTTLYSQLAINCAMNEELPAILFSLEMPDKQIFERMIGQVSGVNTDIFYRGADSDTEFAMANARAMQMVESGNFFIDDTPGVSLSHIIAEARRIKREKGKVGMVLVDYLTLMAAEKADRNDLAYGLITKGLKNLAKELDCVVVLLTQLNRDLEKRVNKRPLPSDSRDTGQIEQDCDYWIGIYREGAYDENANQSDTELLLRLNRHGQSGVVYCEQRNGSIYDCDQVAAEQSRRQREEKASKRGGF
ncbi:DnaB-like helicase C-terminal domain-containing protein [Silvania hatchlandensis]|uniref:DNA 5'-3' helicase n=1 Tax=Silvania hatchlandensis TaxID=2926469 RepID=A0A9J6QCC7_9ENTR|nr:DnaB-like helicase C-terminal domain-containing protein [Silvania hatchlandensis]MCU6666117.1 AAA family ATPase [Silvania hatchlandensis]